MDYSNISSGCLTQQIHIIYIEAAVICHFTILPSKIGVGEFPMTWVVDSSHGEMTVVISFHHGSTMVKWISFHQGRRPEW